MTSKLSYTNFDCRFDSPLSTIQTQMVIRFSGDNNEGIVVKLKPVIVIQEYLMLDGNQIILISNAQFVIFDIFVGQKSMTNEIATLELFIDLLYDKYIFKYIKTRERILLQIIKFYMSNDNNKCNYL